MTSLEDRLIAQYAAQAEEIYQKQTSGGDLTWVGLIASFLIEVDHAREEVAHKERQHLHIYGPWGPSKLINHLAWDHDLRNLPRYGDPELDIIHRRAHGQED